MKKTYETPVAEKIEFCYEEQIVASGTSGCEMMWCQKGDYGCDGGFVCTWTKDH